MNKKFINKLSVGLLIIFILSGATTGRSQTKNRNEVFGRIELLTPSGEKIREDDVSVRFKDDSLQIESARSGEIYKTFNYADIKSAEYSYTKNPRWKTGLGLGATAVIFPPILLVAIPLGFTKHRRHWLTVRTETDYAVLKLSKGTRKIFIPAFESYSSVKVEALGESK